MGFSLGNNDELNSEINITPFVDVVLVLMVIFMVTAPLLNRAVQMELPKTSVTKTVDGNEPILEINKDYKLTLNGKPVTWATLGQELAADPRILEQGVLNISGHPELPYQVVIDAMSLAQEAGVPKVLLAGEGQTDRNMSKYDQGPGSP